MAAKREDAAKDSGSFLATWNHKKLKKSGSWGTVFEDLMKAATSLLSHSVIYTKPFRGTFIF